MKKYTNTAFVYLLASLVCGVFYREFTKYHGYNGETSLAYAHLHLFALGTLLMLLLGLYIERGNLAHNKSFKLFFTLYNFALPMMVTMLLIRGIFQTTGTELSKVLDASVSGFSGIAHILMAISFFFLYLAFKKSELTGKKKGSSYE